MTVEIPLSRGLCAIVDDHDAPFINQFKWYAQECSTHRKTLHYYAVRNLRIDGAGNRRQTLLSMHRFLLEAPASLCVDHINGNGLDNRRSNLRLATLSQNTANRRNIHNPLGFLGVSERRGRFRARIQVHGKDLYSRTFLTLEEAAAAYDCLARTYFGEFASLNFPDHPPSEPPFSPESRKTCHV